jgi:hypothetical protein
MKKIITKGVEIYTYQLNENDYISLTDIARYKNALEPKDVVKNWIRNRSSIEFLGIWEQLNNPNFKGVEFDAFKVESGSNSFVLSPQRWIEVTKAIGLVSRSGSGGGTFAHKDIAFEFASWISAEFKLYLIKEFQRLKAEEDKKLTLGWDVKRQLTKINYRIHTDAVLKKLIPDEISRSQATIIFANEADVLNMALFGLTAKKWRDQHKNREGNIRDYCDVTQLVVLANLESFNAELIDEGLLQSERLLKLNAMAIRQMKALIDSPSLKKLNNKQ